MKKIILLLAISIALSASVYAAEMTFVIDDPGNRNFTEFNSKATIESITGRTNSVGGKVSFDPKDLSKPATGKISVDLRQVSTGIELRDEHMRSDKYLDTEKYPLAIMEVNSVLKADVKSMTDSSPIDVKFKGKFTVHGVTRDVEVSGKATFVNENENLAKSGYPGDMLNFDGGFKFNLSDFNINRPQFLILKLAEEIQVTINFTATTGR